MISNPAFVARIAPLLASVAMIFASAECCSGGPAPVKTPVPTETPTCKMDFTSPNGGAALPATGPVIFSWNPVAASSFYILSVNLPGNAGKVSWNMTTTSRTLYMDSFTTNGSYSANVQARDNNSDILCQANISFSIEPKVKAKKNHQPAASSVPPAAPPIVIKPVP